MLEFAIKYWIEFLFTLIVTGGTFVVKRYVSLIKKERQQKEDEFYKKLQNEIISSLIDLVGSGEEIEDNGYFFNYEY